MNTVFNNIKSVFIAIKQQQKKLLILMDQAIVSGGNFLLGLVLIRFLGLEQYGLFALLWMGVLFGLSLHQAFITIPLMTLAVSKNIPEQKNYFHMLWRIQLVGGGLLAITVLLIGQLGTVWGVDIPWLSYLLIVSLLAISYLLQDFIKKTYFIKGTVIQPFIMDLMTYSGLFIGLFVFENFGKSSLQNTLFLLFGAYSLSSILFSKNLFQSHKTLALPTWQTLVKEHYYFSNWLLGTSIIQWFAGNFFLLTAASLLGTIAVGAVRMGQNIVGLCHLLFLAMENFVPIEAAQNFLKKGMPGLLSYLKNIGLKGGGLVSFILLVLGALAPHLIEWFYGVKYVEYSFVVWGYCGLYFFVFYGFIARYFFRTLHFTKPIFVAYCWSAAFSLIAAYPMVHWWGIGGVLAGLIISQLVTLVTYGYYIFKKQKMVHDKEISSYSKIKAMEQHKTKQPVLNLEKQE